MAILKQLEDEYEILEMLQESGVGTIHKVRHRQLNELRMVLVRPQLLGDGAQLRFLPEAHAVSRLGHANVARVLDASADNDVALVVIELITGVTLAELLARAEPPPVPLTLEIAGQGLRAVGHLHNHHVVHGDVSPDNLMLSRDVHGRPLVKLIDPGIAADLGGASGSTGGGVFLGKLRYAAPETFDDGGPDDPRSDLYSFALVLYELLTGSFPISGESASALIAGHLFRPPLDFSESDPEGRVPEQIRHAVLKTLAKSPGERFADAESFAGALDLPHSGTTGARPDLSAPGVREILELTQGTDRRSDGIAHPPGMEDAPTEILRPEAAGEPSQASGSDAASTRTLRPTPAVGRTYRLNLDQVRIMQADELTARARDRAQAEEFTQARELLRKALTFDPDHPQATALLASIGVGAAPDRTRVGAASDRSRVDETSGRETPSPARAGEVAEQTDRLDDDEVWRALRTEAALAQEPAADEESTTAIRDPLEPEIGHDQGAAPVIETPAGVAAPASEAASASPVALDETLRTIRALCDGGRAGEALERLNRAVREYGPQPTLKTLRDELGQALLERDAEEEESASQMFGVEPVGDPGPGLPPDKAAPAGVPPADPPNLAEAPVRGLSDATIRSFEPPVQQVRDRPDPPTAHPTRNMVAAGLILVVVFAALVFLITRGNQVDEQPPLEAEDVAAADLSPGSLVLDAVPWAEIVTLENPAIEEAPPISPSRFTPVILRLPPGEYWISLRYPPTGQVEERVVRVDSDIQVEERVIFENLDAQTYFERIGW